MVLIEGSPRWFHARPQRALQTGIARGIWIALACAVWRERGLDEPLPLKLVAPESWQPASWQHLPREERKERARRIFEQQLHIQPDTDDEADAGCMAIFTYAKLKGRVSYEQE